MATEQGQVPDAYDDLLEEYRRSTYLSDAGQVLGWDQQVTMPEGGTPARSKQSAALSAVQHDVLTGDGIADPLAELEESSLPVYCVFFALAGAKIDVAKYTELWLVGLILLMFTIRAGAIFTGVRIGCKVAGIQGDAIKRLWMAMIPQAGVAIVFVELIDTSFPNAAWSSQVFLLLMGMIAFVAEAPDGFTDSATVLPVQIYLWAESPGRGFVEKSSAAIMILLVFLVAMNGLAIYLRKRFERRW